MARVIFHVDLDAFYASVEQREHPSLRGVPLIIGADPKAGRGRGVVVACSYEARKFGLHSGQPISRAYRLCPQGVYVPPNLALYGEVSADVMERVKKYADRFEQVSIDEAYLDVTESCKRYGGPTELANLIKTELKEHEGLSCSVGIAPNKSAAKIASDLKKPDGLTYVEPAHIKEFLAALPVSKISGVGKKTEFKLNQLGVETIGDLAKFPPKSLLREFGKSAVWLWAIANGEEQVEVQENYVMKSIGAEHTFDVDTNDWAAIDDELLKLTDLVHRRLIDERKAFRTVTLKIRFVGFETYTRARTLRFTTSAKDAILDAVRALAEEFKHHPKKVRLLGVRLSGFVERGGREAMKETLDAFGPTHP